MRKIASFMNSVDHCQARSKGDLIQPTNRPLHHGISGSDEKQGHIGSELRIYDVTIEGGFKGNRKVCRLRANGVPPLIAMADDPEPEATIQLMSASMTAADAKNTNIQEACGHVEAPFRDDGEDGGAARLSGGGK